MVAIIKYAAPESPVTAMSASLNGLANSTSSSTGKNLSSVIADNATDLYEWMDVSLSLATLTPAAGGRIELTVLYAIDGTNYEAGGTTVDVQGAPTVVFYLNAVAGASLLTAREGSIRIRPFKFKFLLRNLSGVALNASGNVLTFARYNEQVV